MSDRSTGYQKTRYITIVGIFHVLMIMAGWVAGENLSKLIDGYDHWIAFILLAGIGIHMIREGVCPKKKGEEKGTSNFRLLSFRNTLVFGLALSVDALISGFSLGMISVELIDQGAFLNILLAAFIVGACASVISLIAIHIGKKSSPVLGCRAEIFGGLILISIGLKILLEHICSA